MDNLNTNQANNVGRPDFTPNGVAGTWVPVDNQTLPFTVGGDINKPVQGPDGSFYCIGSGATQMGPVASNQYNAIPTPSQQIQLTPIVQPIALVPFASQNQPLLQYDPNQRLPEQPMAPVATNSYKTKAYYGLNIIMTVFALAVLAALIVFNSIKVGVDLVGVKAIDSITDVLSLFNIGQGAGVYSNEFLVFIFSGKFSSGLEENMLQSILAVLVPLLLAVAGVLAVFLTIKYIVKLIQNKAPSGFSVTAFIGLIAIVAVIVIQFVTGDEGKLLYKGVDIGAYIVAGMYLLLFIIPLFTKRSVERTRDTSNGSYRHN